MNSSEPTQSLSAEELDELEAFLVSGATPGDCMDLEMLDGFLTCVVSGPEPVAPEEWLPQVWSSEGAEPSFADPEQGRHVLDLITRHMSGIAHRLLNSPADFAPVLYEAEDQGEQPPLAARWCLGYLSAMELGGSQWKPLTSREELAEGLMPILALAADADEPDFGAAAKDPRTRRQLVDMLPGAATWIHGFWLARRSGWTLPRRHPEKVGRNDPCPCGSGKKYKQCCGPGGGGMTGGATPT